MAVNNISGSMSRADIKIQAAKTEITVKKEESGTTAAARTDSFVKSVSYQSVTYTAPKKLTDKQIEEINNSRTEQMRSMVAQMLGNQARISDKAQGGFDIYEILGADATPETAAAAIAEDGEWGVAAVATRLVDMAISLSGGDSSKAQLLRKAVEDGFKAAGMELGRELPQICKDTYTETMKRFDYWEKNGSMEGYVMDSSKAQKAE